MTTAMTLADIMSQIPLIVGIGYLVKVEKRLAKLETIIQIKLDIKEKDE